MQFLLDPFAGNSPGCALPAAGAFATLWWCVLSGAFRGASKKSGDPARWRREPLDTPPERGGVESRHAAKVPAVTV